MKDVKLVEVLGSRDASALARAFDFHTARDLLDHFPRSYTQHGELTPIAHLPVGENVTIVGRVVSTRVQTMRSRRGHLLHVDISDDSNHRITLTFFNQGWRQKELIPGRRGQFAGKVTRYRQKLQLQNPIYELFADEGTGADGNAGANGNAGADRNAASGEDGSTPGSASPLPLAPLPLAPLPIYPTRGGVTSWTLARLITKVLDTVTIEDPYPSWLGLMPLREAYEKLHRPQRISEVAPARDSMRAREAFDLQLALHHRRRAVQSQTATPRTPGELVARFDRRLPWQLTGDQQRACNTVAAELGRSTPMTRLLQGEVGSGKTVVALRAMLQVAEDGGQSALLAPTEVLAAQHLQSVQELLGPELCEELRPTLITGRLSARERRRALLDAAAGVARIVIGTHALISDGTQFADLGLTVIDEQHRFGVDQREALKQKGRTTPHLLAMTATPIPRTIALTVFGDLELLTIRELPAGRQPIQTFLIHTQNQPDHEALAWRRAGEEVAAGRGVYVVCPAIDADSGDAETRGRATVEAVAEVLRGGKWLGRATIAELTGATPAEEKDRIMAGFHAGEIDVLVSTTVVEVGVNVPRASMMVVLEADRFGVSQLHQLRGRVGRGNLPGLCLFLTETPQDSLAWQRLEAVAATTDGFELAEVDLELRREGDILGTKQSGGGSSGKLLRVTRDVELIQRARAWAEEAFARGLTPELERLIQRQEENLERLAKT